MSDNNDERLQSIDRIKNRLPHKPEQFFDEYDMELSFEELLELLEEESRGIIENRTGDYKFSFQEDVEDVVSCHDSDTLHLPRPVQKIKKIEVTRRDGAWREVSKNSYITKEWGAKLRRRPRGFKDRRRRYNGHHFRDKTHELEWSMLGEEARIKYDRGYKEIPNDIKSVQIKIIKNMLDADRLGQALSTINVDDPNLEGWDKIIDEDIESEIKEMTRRGRSLTVV